MKMWTYIYKFFSNTENKTKVYISKTTFEQIKEGDIATNVL